MSRWKATVVEVALSAAAVREVFACAQRQSRRSGGRFDVRSAHTIGVWPADWTTDVERDRPVGLIVQATEPGRAPVLWHLAWDTEWSSARDMREAFAMLLDALCGPEGSQIAAGPSADRSDPG